MHPLRVLRQQTPRQVRETLVHDGVLFIQLQPEPLQGGESTGLVERFSFGRTKGAVTGLGRPTVRADVTAVNRKGQKECGDKSLYTNQSDGMNRVQEKERLRPREWGRALGVFDLHERRTGNLGEPFVT